MSNMMALNNVLCMMRHWIHSRPSIPELS